jgi:hypothetical protein
MKKGYWSIAAALVIVAAPAAAQSRVYTNADLGRPLSADRPMVTSAELRALKDHQFSETGDDPGLLLGAHDDGAWESPQMTPQGPADSPVWFGGYAAPRHRPTPRLPPRNNRPSRPQSTRQAVQKNPR